MISERASMVAALALLLATNAGAATETTNRYVHVTMHGEAAPRHLPAVELQPVTMHRHRVHASLPATDRAAGALLLRAMRSGGKGRAPGVTTPHAMKYLDRNAALQQEESEDGDPGWLATDEAADPSLEISWGWLADQVSAAKREAKASMRVTRQRDIGEWFETDRQQRPLEITPFDDGLDTLDNTQAGGLWDGPGSRESHADDRDDLSWDLLLETAP